MRKQFVLGKRRVEEQNETLLKEKRLDAHKIEQQQREIERLTELVKENSEERVDHIVSLRIEKFEQKERELVQALKECREELVGSRREVETLWQKLSAKTEALEHFRKKAELNIFAMKENLNRVSYSKVSLFNLQPDVCVECMSDTRRTHAALISCVPCIFSHASFSEFLIQIL